MANHRSPIWADGGQQTAETFPRLDRDLTVDVVVVGGGITGLSVARILKQQGKSVALLEARRVGAGESGRTTAHLTEAMDIPFGELITRFGEEGARMAARAQRQAIETIADCVDDLGIDCDLLRVPGYLYAETSVGVADVEAEAEAARRLGLPASLTSDVPLPFRVRRALRFEAQAQFNPLAYLAALARAVAGGDCHVFEETRVLEVHDGEPCRVRTESGVVTARDVVVAAHVPISNRLFLHTKLAAYRTYVVALRTPPAPPEGLFWDTASPYHYVRRQQLDGGDVILVGGEDHKVGNEDDTMLPFSRLEEYARAHFEDLPVAARWSGQIIQPVDGLPYIGRNSFASHVYVGTGYAGNGMTGGTVAATIIADQIMNVKNPWSDLFDATRIKAVASARSFVSENVDYPVHMIADRLRHEDVDVADIRPGEGALVTVEGERLAVYRSERGILSALSPVCSHLGCLVGWNTTEKSWDCPCHGSRFDALGKVVNGPAVKALTERTIEHPHPEEQEEAVLDLDGGRIPST